MDGEQESGWKKSNSFWYVYYFCTAGLCMSYQWDDLIGKGKATNDQTPESWCHFYLSVIALKIHHIFEFKYWNSIEVLVI